MIHSILIIGQSNMAGRGYLKDAEPLNNRDEVLKVLRNGRWQGLFRPVNFDRPFSGTCLAETFVESYADEHPDVEVGVIPCADGGTRLCQWEEGTILFDNAVFQAKLAMRTSKLVGILWHQGEGDCSEEYYSTYLERITKMMTALRKQIGEDIPIVVGGLGDFLKDRVESPQLVNYHYVNKALEEFARTFPRTVFVSAKGLTSNPDNLHFNHKSLMEFGKRYYSAFKRVENKALFLDDEIKVDDTNRTEMEKL
ncbi:MAG: sialate O-acetylesterase [Clostridia bacterium]|nr:sialate O-acetylesterase [Clostridia bacterium]